MKLSEMLVSGAVAAWALAAIAGATGYYTLKATSNPARAEASQISSWWGTGHRGRHRVRHAAQWCSEDGRGRSLAALTPYIAADLELGNDQKATWNDLASAGDQAMNGLRQSACGKPEGTAPEALAALRRTLTETDRALAAVEPKLLSFYASLDAAQKARLDSYIGRHADRQ